MRQHEVVVDVEQCRLMLSAGFALAQRGDPTPYCRHTLANVEVEPFYKGCIDLPATGRQDMLDRLQRAEHHAVVHPNYALAPVLLKPTVSPAKSSLVYFISIVYIDHPV